MPLTPDMRRQIDQIRDYLFGGGYPNPMANAEQLSFLFFFYLIEGIDAENAQRATVLKQKHQSLFEGDWTLRNPLNAPKKGETSIPKSRFRWSVWARGLSGEALVRFVQDEVFAFFEEVADSSATNFMRGARLNITEPTVLTQVVTLVDGLKLDQADSDTKGDLFEHVLKQIKQAGELGQFRTPRHVIRAIVEMVDPKIGETVYDPAAGTAGFLVAAYNHIRLANSSPAGITETELDGKTQRRGLGDRLSSAQLSTLQSKTFYGNDVDPQMVRLATMNLTLRGLPNVRILLRNVLTSTLDPEKREALELPEEGYHVVLANPPFAGKIDSDRVVDDVKIGNSKATEVLFLHVDNDGYKLDANHDTPIEADDLPELVAAFGTRDGKLKEWAKRDPKAPWHEKWWFADATELRANEFNLSAGRYRPVNASTAVHRDPRELLDELAELEREIAAEVQTLREALV